jgi:hypothetical protein
MSQQASTATKLATGQEIEYKAFIRTFDRAHEEPRTEGVLFLFASCFYDSSGWTISVEEETPDRLNLVEQPPTGIVRRLVTYYTAACTSGIKLSDAPIQITVTDASGNHQVPVRRWIEETHT